MTGLESWLKQATRHLSQESTAQVRAEIREHYESAREAAIAGGATLEKANVSALAALGDAKTANCEYRRVLLTSEEARLLREGNWEAQVVCSRPWGWLLSAVPGAASLAAVVLFIIGAPATARVALAIGLTTGLLFAARFLPVYTPSRGRVFRGVKWVVLVGAFALAFGPDALKMSWLLIACLWSIAWVEWRRVSIRRKLPVARWPKQLYL
ncbi:MAG: hypothetical protein WA869_10120 [Alloacidobacterium sp.]|jgi:hypothetical protein